LGQIASCQQRRHAARRPKDGTRADDYRSVRIGIFSIIFRPGSADIMVRLKRGGHPLATLDPDLADCVSYGKLLAL
jgi:hypothetical protein